MSGSVINRTGIETTGKQLFNVPNTPEGNAFIKLLRKYSNCRIFRPKGRGTRKISGDGAYVPLADSEWMAVYLEPTDEEVENHRTRIKEAEKRGEQNAGHKALWDGAYITEEAIREDERLKVLKDLTESLLRIPEVEGLMTKAVEAHIRAELEPEITKKVKAELAGKISPILT